ncbi:glycosyltransferase family 4 protein [Patescibacteria group bacterium]|nr:glycosyltransferase family 4 protein [Patescibacteria group bacterium]MBU1703258.1 glycosyltransferase family 4 protein [Patescibacteria group bacterium]MBU1953762.1 glycosyltransferase family 4 protein [Patescibacteria group bacterium]
MKIAIDIKGADKEKTGKGWYTYNMVDQLLKLDNFNQYLLYTNNKKNPFPDAKNAQIKCVEDESVKWHYKVLKDLQMEKVDLFFAPTSYIIPAFAPKSLNVIITVHDLVAFLFPATHKAKATIIERLTLKKALKKAKKVFVVSENTRKDLLKRFDYPQQNIHLTPCAPSDFFRTKVSLEDLEAFIAKMKLPEKFILAVGTLEPRKNFATLIKSFVSLQKRHPDYKLVIVGKKGWRFKEIEASIKQYKMEKEVIFPGYVKEDELQKFYGLAKVFIFPSLYEGFGIPPLEAMASGCPVVSSNVASLPEVIGDAGLLIDPKNSYKMAEAVADLIDNDHVRNTMIERGYRQAEKFSWEKSAQVALEVFQTIKKGI